MIRKIKLCDGKTVEAEGRQAVELFRMLVDEKKKSDSLINNTSCIIKYCGIPGAMTLSDIFETDRQFNRYISTNASVNDEIFEIFVRSCLNMLKEEKAFTEKSLLSIYSEYEKNKDKINEDTGSRDADLKKWATALGISAKTDQSELVDFAGNYLLFRPIFKNQSWIISFMTMFPPPKSTLPARFVTRGNSKGITPDHKKVEGIFFIPEGEDNTFVSIGKISNKVKVRMTALSSCAKEPPYNTSAQKNRDLYGIRLALGSVLRGPVSHRIWVSRIPDDQELEYWWDHLGLKSHEDVKKVFGDKIDGFEKIYDWLMRVEVMHILDGTH